MTILRKRRAFRHAFDDFDPDAVAAYDQHHIARLLADENIIRNRGKIVAVIGNARATLKLRDEIGLARLVWSFQPNTTPTSRRFDDIPTSSPESNALAKELRRRGFTFVGPTTMYALMEAIGIIDTHLVDSHRRGSSGIWNA
ncbi:MAG: DNA-3-methyladenine glycosylase [Ilumatobacteraceae bacterium]|nr:DNA-3-methyladenine glycosylase [Ilumatobacteraceae bacterium]